jgi:hypothetical protein
MRAATMTRPRCPECICCLVKSTFGRWHAVCTSAAMRIQYFAGLASLLLATACGSTPGATSSGAVVADAGADTTTDAGGNLDGASTTGTPLTVQVPLDAAKLYRLVGVFYQFDDDYAAPPLDIAFNVPFAPSATTFELPAVTIPGEATRVCPRATKVRGQLPGACDSDAKFHFNIAAIMLVEDVNRDGKVEFVNNQPDKVQGDVIVGAMQAAVLYDPTGGSDLGIGGSSTPLVNEILPKGISFWESYKPATGFDRLRARTGPLVIGKKFPNWT